MEFLTYLSSWIGFRSWDTDGSPVDVHRPSRILGGDVQTFPRLWGRGSGGRDPTEGPGWEYGGRRTNGAFGNGDPPGSVRGGGRTSVWSNQRTGTDPGSRYRSGPTGLSANRSGSARLLRTGISLGNTPCFG